MFHAESATEALAVAKRNVQTAEHNYVNGEGGQVYFEFLGIMELLELGLECDADEVWYNIVEKPHPSKQIPPENELCTLKSAAT